MALVQHATRGDHAAYAMLIGEIDGPESAAAQVLSLVQLCGLLLSQVPTGEREQLLTEAAVVLAQQAEGGGVG